MHKPTVKIRLGESGASFQLRNKSIKNNRVNKQPAGIDFHVMDWNSNEQAVVQLEHGSFSFNINFAEILQGSEERDYIDEGLNDIYIGSGLSADEKIAHDEARVKFMAIIQSLVKLGWQHQNPESCPRLKGEQAFLYVLENTYKYCSLPLNYIPTLEQWMKIDRGIWRMHADGVFMEITFARDRKLLDPNELGAYLLSFKLISKNLYGRNLFVGEDRERWQELWVEAVKSEKKERYAVEAELIKRGFTIDTDYQDPRVHPADPVEP